MYDNFSQGWVDFKKELVYLHGINLNSRTTKYLNTTGKRTKPKTTDMLDDTEMPNAIATAVAMRREKEIGIADLLENCATEPQRLLLIFE